MIAKPASERDLQRLRDLAQQRDHGIGDVQRRKLVKMGLLEQETRPYALTERARRLLAGLVASALVACGGAPFSELSSSKTDAGDEFSFSQDGADVQLELDAGAGDHLEDEVRADRDSGSIGDLDARGVVDDVFSPDRVSPIDASGEAPTAADTGAPDTWVAPVCCYVHCSGPGAAPVPCSIASCPPGGGACSYMTCTGQTGGC